jgi:hypothetical protein
VNSDGTAYLEYEVRNIVNNIITADTLYLMQINPDNSSSSTILSSTTQNQALYPGRIIPDGQGGVLATWTISPASGPVPQYPYQAADFAAGVVGTPYNLPFSPSSVSIGQSPTLVLGENGVAFATDTTDSVNGPAVASFNLSSGSVNWSYQVAAQETITLVAATSGNGLVAKVTQNGTDSVVRFDPTGAATYDTGLPPVSGLQYFVGGMSWLGAPEGESQLTIYADAPITLTSSSYIQTQGNGGQNAADNISLVNPANQTSTFSTTGANQASITSTLQTIVTALPLYSTCNSWFTGAGDFQGTSGLTAIQQFYLGNTPPLFGHASLYKVGALNYTTAAITGNANPDKTPVPGLPVTAATTFNDNGSFFQANDNEGHPFTHIGPRNYTGGSSRAKTLTVIHEVSHFLTVAGFQKDFGKQDVVDANNVLVDNNCRGLIEGPKINKLNPSSGPVGTVVTITGQNFGDFSGPNSTVTFNGVAGAPTSWNQTQIVVAVPAGATTGNVSVTVAGQSATKKFTVQ